MPEPERAEEIFNTQISYLHSLEIDEDFLSQIECPVLLVCGDGDTHCPMVTAFAASQWIPHSCLCIVPRAWHTVYMYNFPLIRAAMLPFMGNIQSRARHDEEDRIQHRSAAERHG